MRKLSLSRVFSETIFKLEEMEELGRRRLAEQDANGDGLEDFSAGLEDDEQAGQQQTAATNAMPQNVQQVWGGPGLSGEEGMSDERSLKTDRRQQEETREKYNLTDEDMISIGQGDFSNVMSKIGDPENFADEIEPWAGSRIAQSIYKFAPELQANPVKNPNAPKLTLANAAKKADLDFKTNQGGISTVPTRAQFSGMEAKPAYGAGGTALNPSPAPAPVARNVPMAHEPTVFSNPQVQNPTRPAPAPVEPPTNPGIRKPRRP